MAILITTNQIARRMSSVYKHTRSYLGSPIHNFLLQSSPKLQHILQSSDIYNFYIARRSFNPISRLSRELVDSIPEFTSDLFSSFPSNLPSDTSMAFACLESSYYLRYQLLRDADWHQCISVLS